MENVSVIALHKINLKFLNDQVFSESIILLLLTEDIF